MNSGDIYTHIKTDNDYVILHDCIIKIDGEWKTGIVYKSLDQSVEKTFVRLQDNFLKSFKWKQ